MQKTLRFKVKNKLNSSLIERLNSPDRMGNSKVDWYSNKGILETEYTVYGEGITPMRRAITRLIGIELEEREY